MAEMFPGLLEVAEWGFRKGLTAPAIARDYNSRPTRAGLASCHAGHVYHCWRKLGLRVGRAEAARRAAEAMRRWRKRPERRHDRERADP